MTRLAYNNIFDALTDDKDEAARLQRWAAAHINLRDIPEGAMRVAPGSDAVVWKTNPEHSGEL